MHRLAWHDQTRNETLIKESLVLSLLDAGETVMLQDGSGRYIFIANLQPIWKAPEKDEVNPTDQEIFGETIAAILTKARNDLAISNNRVTLEVAVGEEHIFQFQLSLATSIDGRSVTKTTIRDVSVERRREKLLRTLLREVSHRSRNLMAIIQSLSDQTARYSSSKEEFLRKFRGRLFALAQSQDLLTDSDWRGASIFNLLTQQVELYLPEYTKLVKLEGDDIFLNPNGAMYIGLAFHELVVNTVSHSHNLSRQQEILVTCRLNDDTVELRWNEIIPSNSDYPSKDETPRQSFGSVVLEKVVPVALNGKATYDISERDIIYSLEFPRSSLA